MYKNNGYPYIIRYNMRLIQMQHNWHFTRLPASAVLTPDLNYHLINELMLHDYHFFCITNAKIGNVRSNSTEQPCNVRIITAQVLKLRITVNIKKLLYTFTLDSFQQINFWAKILVHLVSRIIILAQRALSLQTLNTLHTALSC